MQCNFALCFAMRHQGIYQPEASQIGVKYLAFGIYSLPFALLCSLTDLQVLQMSPFQSSFVMTVWHGV